jgi:hypothetical protein
MPKGWIAVLVFATIGLIGLVVVAMTTTTTRAFTIGVLSTAPSPPIRAGQTACQKPIRVPLGGTFNRVDFEVGTYYQRGPTLDVTVRPLEGSLPRLHGVLRAGYPDVGVQQRHIVKVGRVPTGALIEVCFHNQGPRKVALFGGNDGSATQSTGYIDNNPIGFDFDVVFRGESRSFARLVPEIASRASLFRPPWVAPSLYYLLIFLILVGVPLLLARALRSLE